MLLLGVIGGLLGSSFIALNAKLAAWRKKHLAPYGLKGRLIEGLVISILTSTVSFILPLYFNCQVRAVLYCSSKYTSAGPFTCCYLISNPVHQFYVACSGFIEVSSSSATPLENNRYGV